MRTWLKTNPSPKRVIGVGSKLDQRVSLQVSAYSLPVEPTLASYRTLYPNAGTAELLSAIQTDWYWRIPALRLAEAHANSPAARTYMYEFAWRGSPMFDGRLGAGHSMEIPFVFDTLGNHTEPLHEPNPPQSIATAMHGAWVAFAQKWRAGLAGIRPHPQPTMRFDVSSAVVEDPLAPERAL